MTRVTMRRAAGMALAGTLLPAALVLSACGGEQADPQATEQSGPVSPSNAPSVPQGTDSAGTGSAEGESVPVEHEPSVLPPGDPGLDAPPAPDPGVPEDDRDHEVPALTKVPDPAMLDTQMVSAVLGGSWRRSSGQPLRCLAGDEAVARRSATYRSQDAQVLQTVATHESLAEADRAVLRLGRRLADCGWTGLADPRLGSASAAAEGADGSRTAVVVAAEGVTVTLVGSKGATQSRARWSSLVDLALGDSCAAAAHGCH
jgi:hypothetical protein